MNDAGLGWRARCSPTVDFKLRSNAMEKEHARGSDLRGNGFLDGAGPRTQRPVHPNEPYVS